MVMQKIFNLGNTLSDYQSMFDLRDTEISHCKKILEYGGGLSSFNAEMALNKRSVFSCDPLFKKDVASLSEMLLKEMTHLKEELQKHSERYVFNAKDLMHFVECKKIAAEQCLKDFAERRELGNYSAQDLPKLAFDDYFFDLALVPYTIFQDPKMSQNSKIVPGILKNLLELCRVAKEVRIYPLVDETDRVSLYLGNVMLELQRQAIGVEVRAVDYEFQKGANAMLRIWSTRCVI